MDNFYRKSKMDIKEVFYSIFQISYTMNKIYSKKASCIDFEKLALKSAYYMFL